MVIVDEAFKNAGKTPGLEIWRIKNFKATAIPKADYGYFYSGDSYIVLSSNGDTHGKVYSYNLHYWVGKFTSMDEAGTAAIKTVELDDMFGGLPVQYREVQEYESPLFLSYFKSGIKYLSGGHESGFNRTRGSQKWVPRLFHCKGKRVVRCKQVELSRNSLNLGDVFILDNKTDIYVWCPPESGRLERQKGLEIATSIRDQERAGRGNVHVLDQDWSTHESFWRFVGGKGPVKSAADGGVDLGHWIKEKPKLQLLKVTDASGEIKIHKVAEGDISQNMLDTKDAFILDAGPGGVFVWVGKGCTMDERKNAMQYASDYLKAHNLPPCTQVIRVLESAEPAVFSQWFAQTKAKKAAFKPKLFECSDESGRFTVQEIANFDQKDLDGDDVMLLDACETIFLWIGHAANDNEKKAAQDTAKKYLSSDALPRPAGAKIVTLEQTRETPEFTKHFGKWDANFWKTKKTFEDMKKLAISGK